MSDQPDQQTDRAAPFREMADRISSNASTDFAGAFTIVPPEGDPVVLLMLSAKMEPSIFWGQLKVMAEMAIRDIEQADRRGYR